MRTLALEIDGLELPALEKISNSQEEDPFQVLIATLLSARTQDATTLAASTRLFRAARTPKTMARLPVRQIERLIYPVSFYRHKAKHVKATCRMLVSRFSGRVPTTPVRSPSFRKPLDVWALLAYLDCTLPSRPEQRARTRAASSRGENGLTR